jgi:hypothetical protein
MTGCKEYCQNKSLFKKVLVYYLYDLNKNAKKLLNKYKTYIEKEKFVDYTSIYKKAINKFKIKYPSGGCTTGFSAVLYFLYKNINSIFDIKQENEIVPIEIKNLSNIVNNIVNNELIIDDDINKSLDMYNYEKEKIVLVGFTGIYNGKVLTSWHRCDFEQEFYKKLLAKKIIQKIDLEHKVKPKKKIIKNIKNISNTKKINIKKILVKKINKK